MTPNELYKYYLSKYMASDSSDSIGSSVSSVQPTYTLPEVLPVGGDSTTTTGPTSTGKGIGSISMSDIGKAIGFAMNPALGIASLGFTAATGKTPMQAVQDTLASMGIGTAATGPTAPGAGMGITGGYATDVGFGGMGTGDAGTASAVGVGTDASGNDTSPGATGGAGGESGDGGAAAGGDAGAAAASAAGSNDGPGGGTFAQGGRVGYAQGSIAKNAIAPVLKNIMGGDYEYISPKGKSYNYDFIKSLPGTPGAAAQKFGREAIYGTTVNAGDNDITTPGKYASYYDVQGAFGDASSPGLKQEYSFIQDYILKPENLVRDYGLEGARKILTPYVKQITPTPKPKPKPEPEPLVIPTVTPTPVDNYINSMEGSGVPLNPVLNEYRDYVESYSTPIAEPKPYLDFQSFMGGTGPLKTGIETAVSGLPPFYKQQYQDYAINYPRQTLEAALRNLEFLVATGNRPSYLQEGGRVGYLQGGLVSLLR